MSDLIQIAAPPPILDRLAAWSEQAAGSFSEATEAAVRTDMRLFSAWCLQQGLPALPAAPETVAAFLRAQSAAGRAMATVKRRAASIAFVHRAAGLENPCASEPVRLALKAIRRERGTQQRQAPGLVDRDALQIAAHVEAAGPRLKDLRDLALVLVGRDLLARASELVAVTVESIAWQPEGTAQIALRRRKTDTEPKLQHVGREASRALQRWLEASGIASGPIFLGVTKGGRLTSKAIHRSQLTRVLKELGARARVEVEGRGFSAHSLRVGMAQDLAAASAGLPEIMTAGGWKSPAMVARYTEAIQVGRGAVAQYYARKGR